jgi:phosphatidylglycerol:prolipoprotein diacylglycerol transferase
MNATLSIIAGFGFAALFQCFYNLVATGAFEYTGITFMGGLFGGALIFVILTLVVMIGKRRKQIWNTMNLAAIAITAGHSLGRIGCFCAGCCYGIESPYGLVFPKLGRRVLPTQLYEAVFLAALCGVLLLLSLKFQRKGILLIVYMYSYSIFRFFLEFLRGDEGRAVVGIFSPSQWLSIILFAAATFLSISVFVFKRVPFGGKIEGRAMSKYLYDARADK